MKYRPYMLILTAVLLAVSSPAFSKEADANDDRRHPDFKDGDHKLQHDDGKQDERHPKDRHAFGRHGQRGMSFGSFGRHGGRHFRHNRMAKLRHEAERYAPDLKIDSVRPLPRGHGVVITGRSEDRRVAMVFGQDGRLWALRFSPDERREDRHGNNERNNRNWRDGDRRNEQDGFEGPRDFMRDGDRHNMRGGRDGDTWGMSRDGDRPGMRDDGDGDRRGMFQHGDRHDMRDDGDGNRRRMSDDGDRDGWGKENGNASHDGDHHGMHNHDGDDHDAPPHHDHSNESDQSHGHHDHGDDNE